MGQTSDGSEYSTTSKNYIIWHTVNFIKQPSFTKYLDIFAFNYVLSQFPR